jgi:predicted dehydrogenase
MQRKVKIGLIGSAFCAELHIEGFRKAADISEVVAVCARNREKAEAFAGKHGIRKVYSNYHELLQDEEVEVADICLPNFLHAQVAIEAFNAGKNVICEKPLATTLEDARGMLDAAAKSGKTLFYAEDWLFSPVFLRAIELIEEGAIGRPLFFKAKESHSGSHSPFAQTIEYCGGGAMIHLGIHPLGLLLALNGRPTEVMAMASGGLDSNLMHKKMEGEDWASALIKFENGATAIVEANYITKGGMHDILEVYGSEGMINVNLMNNPIKIFSLPGFSYAVEKAEITQGWSCPAVDEKLMLGYVGEIRHFMECMLTGAEPKRGLRGVDGYEAMRLCFDIYKSAREGTKVYPTQE